MISIREQYDKLHAACPVCKSAAIETSCVGYLMDNLETARDENRAHCECGWRGIVHDMVRAPTDCGRERTHDLARECQCDACKKWWCENVPGYFVCPRCNQVCLELAERCGDICETCFDQEVEEELE